MFRRGIVSGTRAVRVPRATYVVKPIAIPPLNRLLKPKDITRIVLRGESDMDIHFNTGSTVHFSHEDIIQRDDFLEFVDLMTPHTDVLVESDDPEGDLYKKFYLEYYIRKE